MRNQTLEDGGQGSYRALLICSLPRFKYDYHDDGQTYGHVWPGCMKG